MEVFDDNCSKLLCHQTRQLVLLVVALVEDVRMNLSQHQDCFATSLGALLAPCYSAWGSPKCFLRLTVVARILELITGADSALRYKLAGHPAVVLLEG